MKKRNNFNTFQIIANFNDYNDHIIYFFLNLYALIKLYFEKKAI